MLNEPTLSLRLVDVETNSSPIPILFLKKEVAVIVEGLDWLAKNEAARKIDNSFVHKTSDKSFLIYSTFVNEHQVANGTIDLSENWKRNSTVGVPSSIGVGVIEVETSGHNVIHVELYSVLSGNVIESSATLEVRSCQRWIAGIPIIIGFGLFLVFNVHIVHSLFCALFIGSCIIEGSVINVEAQGDDSDFLILVLASLLSGAIAGEHIGPFLETSILSALISQSEVRRHFLTQLPYASFIVILSIMVGTVPTSYNNYPSYVGHVVGIAVMALFVTLVCRQVERHQSSIPGQIRDEPITQSLHSMVTRKKRLARKENIAIDSKSGVSFERESKEFNLEDVSIVDASTMHQGTEVVAKIGNRMQNKNIVHRGVHDPIDRENR